MLYPAELRDRLAVMACCALLLKGGAAWAAHPCAWREAVETEGREVVAVGVAWPNGTAPVTPKGRFHPTERKPDRYERWHGFMFEADATEPVQMRWLRQGIAFADVSGLKPACRDALLLAEAEARAAKRGLWRGGGIERADDPTLVRRADRFAVVEGRIVSVGDRTRWLYLNFGTFWRQDFTVQIDKRDLKRHPELLARLLRAEGRTVRVRGRMSVRDGPFMRVRDAGQIEFPAEPSG